MDEIHVLCPLASSLDGKIASYIGESDADRRAYGFGCEADHLVLLEVLSQSDAVIIGGRSARAESGVIPLRNDKGVIPPWVVISRSAAPLSGRSPDGPIWYVGPDLNDPSKQLEYVDKIFPANSQNLPDLLTLILKLLKSQNLNRVALLGGGEILANFLEIQAVDELWITVCPVFIGAESAVSSIAQILSKPVKFKLQASRTAQDHVFLKYLIAKT